MFQCRLKSNYCFGVRNGVSSDSVSRPDVNTVLLQDMNTMTTKEDFELIREGHNTALSELRPHGLMMTGTNQP